MSAADIAKALNGRKNGDDWLVSCPLPSHGKGRGDRIPSLSIRDGERADLAVHCFAGCDPRDILAEFRRLGLLERQGSTPIAAPTPRRCQMFEPSARALELWRAARPDGAVVNAYLQQTRGLRIPAPPTLRQGTALIYGRTPVPTMVAAVQAPDRRVVAVQELRLTWSGRKAPMNAPRKTTGAIAGCAVRLGAAGDVLGLAEGIETGLSAMQMSGVPVWCSLGAENLANVEIPDVVRDLVIFADADDPGQRGATRAAHRWARANIHVTIRTPLDANDWNDTLQLSAVAA